MRRALSPVRQDIDFRQTDIFLLETNAFLVTSYVEIFKKRKVFAT